MFGVVAGVRVRIYGLFLWIEDAYYKSIDKKAQGSQGRKE
jgi:hypothetical protein